jgi:transcriptional regulator with XRE-family HTH domain
MNYTLYVARKAKGWSVSQAASETGILLPIYKTLESGELIIKTDTAEKLSTAYGAEPSAFLASEGRIVNYNDGDHSKGIVNSETFHENWDSNFTKEIFEKMQKERDKLLKENLSLKSKLAKMEEKISIR